MDVAYAKAADKALQGLNAKDRAALVAEIERFAADPRHPGKPVNVFTETTGRVRHGNYRATYTIIPETDTLRIDRVAHRKEVYE